jgi:hypothetical protein
VLPTYRGITAQTTEQLRAAGWSEEKIAAAAARRAARMGSIRPLRRVNAGTWRSRDGRWTFMRHLSDPSPQRWFAYRDDDESPSNDGLGHTTLRAVVAWLEGRA